MSAIWQSIWQPVWRSVWDDPWGETAFDILSLFAGGEQGALYDPSVLTSLFQERTGAAATTPSTVGEVVGTVLDLSGRGNHATAPSDAARLLLGREPEGGRRNLVILSENEFSTNPWQVQFLTTSVDADGWFQLTNTTDDNTHRIFNPDGITYEKDVTYTLSVFVKNVDAGWVKIAAYRGGVYNAWVNLNLQTGATGNTGGIISSAVEDYGDGVYRLSMTLNGEGGNNYTINVIEEDFAGQGAEYVGTLKSIKVKRIQLELGSTATPYQRVGASSLDVTEAGKRDCYYLFFNGTNSGMSTAEIDFTATDKMSFLAGLRKTGDTLYMVLAEIGHSQSFVFCANEDINRVFSSLYFDTLSGSFPDGGLPGQYAATMLADKAASGNTNALIFRRNGVPVSVVSIEEGISGGNFGNFPLFIGSRNFSSLFFGGRIYSLIVRGAASTTKEIEIGEKFTAQKTGVNLP
jgi:hypothetical protein